MSIYYCYQIWNFLDPDVSKLRFMNDKEALDYWLDLYEENRLEACFSIVRLAEIEGAFFEVFVAMIKRTKNGLQVIKSHAL